MTRAKESKLEYKQVLNELFGIEIAWDKLPLNDLKLLAKVLTSDITRAEICKKLQCKCDVVGIIDGIIPPEMQGPVIQGLKKILKGEIGVGVNKQEAENETETE